MSEEAFRESAINPLLEAVTGEALPSRGRSYSRSAAVATAGLTLRGHTDAVPAVAITPDGRRIVSGGKDGTSRIWDLGAGIEIGRFEGPTAPVTSVAFLNDGRQVVSADSGGALHVWESETGRLVVKLQKGDTPIEQLTVSNDGRLVLSASHRTAHVWDVRNGSYVRKLGSFFCDTHDGYVTAVAFSPDGQQALTGSHYGEIKVWDLGAARVLHTFNIFSRILGLSFLRGGARILVGTDTTQYLIDARSWRDPERFSCEAAQWTAFAVSNSSGRLAVADVYDGGYWVRVLNLKTGKQITSNGGHAKRVRAMAISGDGRCIVSGSDDSTMRVWDCD